MPMAVKPKTLALGAVAAVLAAATAYDLTVGLANMAEH